ncbi:hypothetical protein HKCCE2091_12980 [Rhodobacterales bacterium HKCCE2091]|nr:hypothetical protein [Rhodobacterales bacterium HKCCE2091]
MIRITLLALALAGLPAAAPAQEASVEFNLFELEGFTRARIFEFDEDYTEQFGIDVPVPFQVSIPIDDSIELISDGRPDGGAFVKFTFATAEENRRFVENIQIVDATFPIPEGVEDPEGQRIMIAARLLQEQVFPQAVQGFSDPEVLALERFEVGEIVGARLVGSYVDPTIGPMLLHLVALPHPRQAESYVAVANINLTLVPVTTPESLTGALTSRVLGSFTYR